MSSARGVLRGAAVTSVMRLGVAALSFVFFAIVARRWGAARLGELSIAYTWFVMLQQVPLLGLHYLVGRDLAQARGDGADMVSNLTALGLVMATVLGVALGLGGMVGYGPSLHVPLWIVAGTLLPSAVIAAAETVLIARERLEVVAGLTVGESLLRTLAWLVAIYFGGGIETLLVILLVGRLITAAIYVVRRSEVRALLRPMGVRVSGIAALLTASPPLLGILLLTALINRLDFLILSKLASETAIGLYSAPYRIYEGMLMVPQALSIALFPRVARMFAAAEEAEAKGETPAEPADQLVRQVCRATAVLGAPGAILLAMIAAPLVHTFYGPAFDAASPVLVWLAAAPIFVAIDQTLGLVLLATRRQGADLGVLAVACAFYAAALAWAVPRYGFVGAAAATLITAVLQTGVRYYVVRTRVRIRSLLGILGRPALAAAGAVTVAVLLRDAGRPLAIVATLGTYAALAVALGALRPAELQALLGTLRRRGAPVAPIAPMAPVPAAIGIDVTEVVP